MNAEKVRGMKCATSVNEIKIKWKIYLWIVPEIFVSGDNWPRRWWCCWFGTLSRSIVDKWRRYSRQSQPYVPRTSSRDFVVCLWLPFVLPAPSDKCLISGRRMASNSRTIDHKCKQRRSFERATNAGLLEDLLIVWLPCCLNLFYCLFV